MGFPWITVQIQELHFINTGPNLAEVGFKLQLTIIIIF